MDSVEGINNLENALETIENLEDLLQNNEYQSYIYQHLMSVRVELERQLTKEKFKLNNAT